MENVTYAKIMGLARDENSLPAFGYMKLEGVKLQKDTVARLLNTTCLLYTSPSPRDRG